DTSLYNSRQRASFIAHGAVLENMDIAARSHGYSMRPTLFPASAGGRTSSKGEQNSLIAAIEFQESPKVNDPLLPFITKRVTNRNPYKRKRHIDKEAIAALMSIPTGKNIGELYLEGAREKMRFLAKAVAMHDRILFENEKLHHFVFEHIRWSEKEASKTKDGMPLKTMGLNSLQTPAFKLLGNWGLVSFLNLFGLSRIIPFQSYKLCIGSSALGLIQMPGTTPEDFVLGGRLLQKVWLTATKHGLAFHPMTGITFLMQRIYIDGEPGFSETHKKLLEKAWGYLRNVFPVDKSKGIIMLFRIGYASIPSVRAPRRAVDDIFDI
ncbi:MAG: nitroreductase, partial [Deltaproteobacteria bacterium]|nr:nitroreductase [Deltaproteobacteria bacterium]